MKIATLNRGKETKYLNEYPLVDEEDIYAHDHLKEGDLFYLMNDRDHYLKMPKLNVNISIILMGRMLFVFLMVKAMV